MADIPVPFTDQDVSTDNASSIPMKIAVGSLGFMLLFVMVALGRWSFNQVSEAVGAGDASQQVPGV
jgi:hypothetical protein